MTIRKIGLHVSEDVHERFVKMCELHSVSQGALLEAWLIELTEPPTRRTELRLVSERRAAAVRWARKIDASRRKRERHARGSNEEPPGEDQQQG